MALFKTNPIKWEFESNECGQADALLRVLDGFGLIPEDIYIMEKGIDFSMIEFRCDRKTLLRIHYTLREMLNLPKRYLMEGDWTESMLEQTCNEGYIIWGG